MHPWLTERRRTLAMLLLLIAPGFAVTATVTRLFHERERAAAAERFARGNAALARGDAAGAVDELRTALSLYHVSPPTRLRLAQALTAAGRPAEARSHLLTLREQQPGNGVINLELARLAAADGDVPAATRYFRDAVEGAWDADTERRRRETRLELAEMLVHVHDLPRAQAELTLATTDLPDDAAFHVRVARLLSAAGAHERAFEVYRSALALAPKDAAALAGAGAEAVATGRYATARGYLAKALARDPSNAHVRGQLATLSSVAALDPFARGVAARERARRALDAFAYAGARLAACRAESGAPQGDALGALLDEWHGLEKSVVPKALARDPDLLDRTMDLVFNVEERTRTACGEPQGVDFALLLIGRDRRAVER